jgi:uncharacterized membrane protein YesL
MTHAALRTDHLTDAGREPAAEGQVGGKLYAFVDAVTFVGVLNVMIIVMTFAGGVFLGAAPAHAAAAGTVRARLRGDGGSTAARFARLWRRNFVRANRLQGPGLFAGILLAANLFVFGPEHGLLGAALVAALAIVVVYQITLVAMDAHYDLEVRDCLALAWRFLLVAPGAPLLLAAAICVIAFVTWLLPGLLPVFSLGAAAYITTALCLSFFAANDKRVAA